MVKNLSVKTTKKSGAETPKAETPQMVKSYPLSPNMAARIEGIKKQFEQVQQQFQNELNTSLSCYAEGVGIGENQFFQLSADGKSIEIYEKTAA